jgi:N-acyl-D-aspartate/D-glutamate deacylase
MNSHVAIVSSLAGLALVGLVAARRSAQSDSPTLFEGARLIAGDGRAPIENSAILVENGSIVRVGRRGGIPLPRYTHRVDVTGKTIIPGLVLAHGHIGYLKGTTFAASNYTRDNLLDHLNRYLYYGVVAMVSTGTDPGDLPYQIRKEPHPGALFRTAGRGLAAPDASTGNLAMRGVAYGVTTEEQARRDVRELAANKPDFVKIWVDDRNGAVKKLAAGLTPMQAIVAATRTPAELLHLNRLGTVAPGKSADFVVLEANPLDNIANTRTIAAVYQRGAEVDRASMRKGWTGR